MCLDIHPGSVIHKHLVKKITTLNEEHYTDTGGYDTGFETLINPIINRETDRKEFDEMVIKHGNSLEDCYAECESEHNLTMLPSFHISLGKPPSNNMEETHKPLISSVNNRSHSATSREYTPLIGEIALAPINISKQNNKKSAWIPLNTEWLSYVIGLYHDINLNQFKCYDVPLGKCTKTQLHISLANLTGNPRDSIARPEDCIIDTITS